MSITDIRLQNFRSYRDASFDVSSNVNIIVGPNASGKTNLIEAVLLLAGHDSYRASVSELISFGKPWARLDAHTPTSIRTVKIQPKPAGKTYEVDGNSYQRLASTKKIPVCLFEPDHLLILNGPPELRRKYIDNLCEQIYPAYSSNSKQYKRVLAQRNRLLKQSHPDRQIFSWNIRLAELAGQLVTARLKLTDNLNQNIRETYRTLAGSMDKIGIEYYSSIKTENYETNLLKKLEEKLTLEIERGFTLYGPHRDDLIFYLNGINSNISASRGEIRTLVLALKILEAGILENALDKKPIFLLDDVFSELDGRRRHQLTNYLKSHQTFITTTDADVVLQHFSSDTSLIPLAKNKR